MKKSSTTLIAPFDQLQNIDSRYSPNELQLQSRKYIGNSNPKANSNTSVQPQISSKRAESILIQGQPLQPSIKSPTNKSPCNLKEGEKTTQCECCLNQMKALILTLADNDPDLASRIVASTEKATLYKDYALNNYDTAALNPHNYRSDSDLKLLLLRLSARFRFSFSFSQFQFLQNQQLIP